MIVQVSVYRCRKSCFCCNPCCCHDFWAVGDWNFDEDIGDSTSILQLLRLRISLGLVDAADAAAVVFGEAVDPAAAAGVEVDEVVEEESASDAGSE